MDNFFLLQVDWTRAFRFRCSERDYEGIPVVAANMDTVGTFEMAVALDKVNFLKIDNFKLSLKNKSKILIKFFSLVCSTNVLPPFTNIIR